MKIRWSLCTSAGIGVVVSALAFTFSATAAPLASTHPPVASVDGTTRAAPAGAPQPRAALPSSQRALLPGDTQDLRTTEPHIITDLLPAKLKATYNAVHAAAPNAVIFVGAGIRSCLHPTAATDLAWRRSPKVTSYGSTRWAR